jgi:hypothetical protein
MITYVHNFLIINYIVKLFVHLDTSKYEIRQNERYFLIAFHFNDILIFLFHSGFDFSIQKDLFLCPICTFEQTLPCVNNGRQQRTANSEFFSNTDIPL